MHYYHFQAKRGIGYLGEGLIFIKRLLDFKRLSLLIPIIIFYDYQLKLDPDQRCMDYENLEYQVKITLIILLFKLIFIICDICFYTKEYLNLLGNLHFLDLSDINNWNNDSKIWEPIWYSHLKNYDYFTIKIGKELGIPPFYNYEYLNYPNLKSQVILDICVNAYREILNNGLTFAYHLTPLESRILGIDTIGPDPALDGLILDNIDIFQPNDLPYGKYHYYYLVIGCNGLPCDFRNPIQILGKISEIINHLAGIKGRFDTLNNNPYESEKMDKGMEVIGLRSVRWFIKVSGNTSNGRNDIETNDVSKYIDKGLGDTLDSYRPKRILKEHLEMYQNLQDTLAARQAQAALTDNQGNDGQIMDTSTLHAIDDTY